MNRVVHFEIHVEDVKRAVAFYSGLFGWKFTKWHGPVDYWSIETGTTEPGIDGGLLPRKSITDSEAVTAYICTIEVDNLDKMVARAQASGASIAVPKMAIPGIGWLAYLKDTERNTFGIMQSDPTAK